MKEIIFTLCARQFEISRNLFYSLFSDVPHDCSCIFWTLGDFSCQKLLELTAMINLDGEIEKHVTAEHFIISRATRNLLKAKGAKDFRWKKEKKRRKSIAAKLAKGGSQFKHLMAFNRGTNNLVIVCRQRTTHEEGQEKLEMLAQLDDGYKSLIN